MSTPELDRIGEIPDPLATPTAAHSTLDERIQRVVLAEPAPARAVVERRRVIALGTALGWVALLVLALGPRRDLATLSPLYLGVWLGAPFVLAAALLVGALRRSPSGLGIPVGVSAALALAAPLALGSAALLLTPPGLVTENADFARAACICLGLTLVGSAAPLGLAAFSLRRAFPAGAGWRSALVGGAAGLLGGGALNLHCSFVSPLHLLLGHALPVAIATALGALVGYRLMRA